MLKPSIAINDVISSYTDQSLNQMGILNIIDAATS